MSRIFRLRCGPRDRGGVHLFARKRRGPRKFGRGGERTEKRGEEVTREQRESDDDENDDGEFAGWTTRVKK